MKRFLLTAAAALTLTGAFAASPALNLRLGQSREMSRPERPMRHVVKSPAAEAGKMMRAPLLRENSEELEMGWTYCEGANTACPTNYGLFKAAIQMPADVAQKFAGATVSSLSVASPVDAATGTPNPETGYYDYTNPIRDIEVWITTDNLQNEPVAVGKGVMSEESFVWNEIEFDTPYVITGDKPLFFGYTIDVPEIESMYAIVTDDGFPDNTYSCYCYTTFEGYDSEWWPIYGDEYNWEEMGADFGNAAIKVNLKGDMLPVNDLKIVNYAMPTILTPGEPLEVGVMVQNVAANKVSTFTLTCEVGNMEPQSVELPVGDTPIPYLERAIAYTSYSCNEIGNNIPVKLYISAINGESVDLPYAKIEGYVLCIEQGYPRNLTFEEFTGTWCGWCVYGYAGMEYMAENYADKGFIGIGVHNGDPMETLCAGGAYEFLSNKIGGFPSSFINRDVRNDIYPDPYELEYTYSQYIDLPAFAQVRANLENAGSNRTLKLSTFSKFAMPVETEAYSIGYVVMEDEVGPYRQTNYLSGDTDNETYGFGELPDPVRLKYNDVARNCSKPEGIEGSLPEEMAQDEEYGYSVEIVLPEDNVKDPTKVRVVAMIVNNISGVIENACVVKAPDYSGVNQISVTKELPVAYGGQGEIRFRVNGAAASVYTLDGRCIARGVKGQRLNVPAGIYLVTLDGKSVKVAVR